jgi:hypothetical protein
MLITEDGSGKPDAESYCDVATADAYHTARGNSAWTALDTTTKEQYLRRATDYMTAFRGRWAGFKKTTSQALDWPRFNVPVKEAVYGYGEHLAYGVAYWPDNEVPDGVVRACAELALRVANGVDLLPDTEAQVSREVIGPLQVEYEQGAPQVPRFYAVEQLLSPFFGGTPNAMKVGRA